MTVAHILGLPIEESVVQLAPAGAAIATVLAIGARTSIKRLRGLSRSAKRLKSP